MNTSIQQFILVSFFISWGLISCQDKKEAQSEERPEVLRVSDDLQEVRNGEVLDELTLDDIPEKGNTINTVNFTGSYVMPMRDGASFTVELSQKGDSVLGTYCGRTANKSDCGMPSQGAPDCGIKGVIRNNVAYILFRSCYVGKQGKANLKVVGNDIIWNTRLYPKNEGSMYFCAAPDSALLLNKQQSFDGPARLPDYKAHSGEFLTMSSNKESVILLESKILHSPEKQDFKTQLYAGTPVKILSEEEGYAYGQIGDEIFEAPAYLIEYEEHGQTQSGYVHHGDIALDHFTDNRGSTIMLGLFEEDLQWVVKNPIGEIQRISTGVKKLTEIPGVHFPVFNYRVQTLPALPMGDLSFIQLDLEYNKYQEKQKLSNLFSWDGKVLRPVMPELAQNRPYNLQVEIQDHLLKLSFKTDKSFFTDEKYAEAIQTQYLAYRDGKFYQPENAHRIALAHLGDQNEFTFPDSLEALDWYGVRNIGNEILCEPIKLSIEKEEAENELVGKWIKKKISVDKDETYDFILSGLPEIDHEMLRKPGSFTEGDCNPGDEKSFIWEGSDWSFIATGKKDQFGPVEFSLLLQGSRDSGRLEQYLHFSPFREYPVEFLWAGDLDGDGFPDFIIDVAEKGITSDSRLYLSSFAKEGQLVGLAGSFYANMPGC